MKLAMIRLHKACRPAAGALAAAGIHELILEARARLQRGRTVKSGKVELRVPLKVDIGTGSSWAAAKG
jgi:DNA polymerase I-like protein with 3'-5' exonuclease and polymerase domains